MAKAVLAGEVTVSEARRKLGKDGKPMQPFAFYAWVGQYAIENAQALTPPPAVSYEQIEAILSEWAAGKTSSDLALMAVAGRLSLAKMHSTHT